MSAQRSFSQPSADHANLIGKRYVSGGRAYEVLRGSERRPATCQVLVYSTDKPRETGVAGSMLIRDVLAMTLAC